MGPLLPSCTDGVDILFAGLGLCTSQSRFERFSTVASATRKMSLIRALNVLMKSCRFWCWKTEPKQQVEQEQDVDRINE